MSDLISREQTIEEIKSVFEWHDVVTLDRLVEHIKALPSAEPVIRCKDCKWCREHYDTDGNAPYWACTNWDGGTDADGFCHEAERRTDE